MMKSRGKSCGGVKLLPQHMGAQLVISSQVLSQGENPGMDVVPRLMVIGRYQRVANSFRSETAFYHDVPCQTEHGLHLIQRNSLLCTIHKRKHHFRLPIVIHMHSLLMRHAYED